MTTIALVSIFLNLLSSLSFAGQKFYWPDCQDIGGQEIPEEIRRVSCDNQEIARNILKQEEVVPSKIYHFGKKPDMDRNVDARTIPKEDWERFIMGSGGRYQLKPFRRGL